MSLSGAMTSAVTGMDAQSRALGAISDNISNSQTTGYKRVDTEFSTLLTVSNALVHDPGGVKSKPLYTNDLQGTVQQTSVETNLAVSGDGYFAVSRVQGVSGSSVPTFEADPLYTRAGDFALDNNGFLVNNGGYYLNGWAVNPQTNVVAKNQLVQIQLNQLKASPQPTSTITYSANLPTNPSQNLNIGATTPLPFGQKFTFGSAPNPPTFSNGDTITVTKGGVPKTFVLSDASAGVPATAGAGQVLISYNSTISSPAQILGIVATGISGATFATSVVTTPASLQFAPTSVNIFDAQGSPHSIDVNWTKVAGTNDTYTVTFTSTDPAVGSILPVSASTVVFNLIDNPATGAKAGSIKSINGVAGGVNTAAAIPLTVNFGGSTPTTQAVSFGLGNFGVPQQTTMFTGTDINFISALQDGLPPGSFRNLDIDAHGLVTLNFDNGARKTEFQIPLVQFSNYNGLQPVNGNAFSTTVASGTPGVHAAGDSGTGSINASSVEGADVDIAAEFTKLIQTQRAYEANSKVITTTNDLLQVTDNMIR
jgi:flagellar hook protein FlgE